MKYIVLNSPYLGGAERSIVYQMAMQSTEDIYFILPTLCAGDTDELVRFICETMHCGSDRIQMINFPSSLFSVSRTNSLINNLFGLLSLPLLIFRLKKTLRESSLLWCNGNKVGLPFYLAARIYGLSGKFIWHFRDYPSEGRLFRQIWNLFGGEKFSFTCVGNSQSVAEKIRQVTNDEINICAIYNPVGRLNLTPKGSGGVKHIGCVSMLAPWKGIHEVVDCALFYEAELIAMGIESIKIYGAQIYKTSGEHSSYFEEIQEIAKDSKLIKFMGKKNPEEIYSEIDLLIHSSISPEPFGRVLTEAFYANVPVISTALGGSGEIVINRETGLRYFPQHYAQLFECIKQLVQSDRLRSDICAGAKIKLAEIEKNIQVGVQRLLNEN